jgi:hydrogenase maturation protease
LVLGIGNTLLTDEGIGVHVINLLQQRYPEVAEATFLDGGTLSFSLAGDLAEHQRLIVVDAAHTGSEPGTVVCYEGAEMDRYLKGNRKSVHEVGLGDLLDIARLSNHYPEQRALVGIEPLSMEWGETVSDPVAPALTEAAERVMELVERWKQQ